MPWSSLPRTHFRQPFNSPQLILRGNMSKSDIVRQIAKEMGWPIMELKQFVGINLSPGTIEKARCINKAPSYEQMIVHMYREARHIVNVGEDLKVELFIAQHEYFHVSILLRATRKSAGHVDHKIVLIALDKLWLAQEKYEAWARTYGDL